MSPENQGLSTRLFGDITILFRRHLVFGDIPDVIRKHYHIKYELYEYLSIVRRVFIVPNQLLFEDVLKHSKSCKTRDSRTQRSFKVGTP